MSLINSFTASFSVLNSNLNLSMPVCSLTNSFKLPALGNPEVLVLIVFQFIAHAVIAIVFRSGHDFLKSFTLAFVSCAFFRQQKVAKYTTTLWYSLSITKC